LTAFDVPVYRLIAITEDVSAGVQNCLSQTLAPNDLYPFEFRGIKLYADDDPVASVDLNQGFTNDDPTNCPIEFTLLSESKTTLDPALATAFTIDGSGVVQVTQANYQGGTIIMWIRARTGWNDPLFKEFVVR
jgi:hypothetical protein